MGTTLSFRVPTPDAHSKSPSGFERACTRMHAHAAVLMQLDEKEEEEVMPSIIGHHSCTSSLRLPCLVPAVSFESPSVVVKHLRLCI